jgi:predicted metal-dependent hydrolase
MMNENDEMYVERTFIELVNAASDILSIPGGRDRLLHFIETETNHDKAVLLFAAVKLAEEKAEEKNVPSILKPQAG